MPEPVLSSEFMVLSVAETEKYVKTKKKPAALGRSGDTPSVPKPLVCVPVDGKRQTGPAAMDYPFA